MLATWERDLSGEYRGSGTWEMARGGELEADGPGVVLPVGIADEGGRGQRAETRAGGERCLQGGPQPEGTV